MYRLLLAGLIALAVAVAPLGSALAAADAMAKPAMEDCHGKKASEDHSCCDAMAKCPDQCGVKCCKLMGMIVALAVIRAPVPAGFKLLNPRSHPTGGFARARLLLDPNSLDATLAATSGTVAADARIARWEQTDHDREG